MLSTVYSFFFPNKLESTKEQKLIDAFSVLDGIEVEKQPDTPAIANENDDDLPEFVCYRESGEVTKQKDNIFFIDDKYKFKSTNDSMKVGCKISYVRYKDKTGVKISDVKLLMDEWDTEFARDGEGKWCMRSTIGEVYKRIGRVLYVKPQDIEVDLNSTHSEFVPIVGDWLQLEVKSEIDENVTNLFGKILEVSKISPLRIKMVDGCIKSYNPTSYIGRIDRDVYFDRSALFEGYIPAVNDRVVAEVIESNQGNCSWRALKVLQQSAAPVEHFEQAKAVEYELSCEGIQITENIVIDAKSISERYKFTVEVKNECNNEIELINVEFDSNCSQLSLSFPTDFQRTVIKTGDAITLEFQAVPKCYGESREVILFKFKNVTVGRFVYINLGSSVEPMQHQQYNKKNRYGDYRGRMQDVRNLQHRNKIRGEGFKVAPRFVSNRLGEYRIPDDLYDIMSQSSNVKEDLYKLKPLLKNSLNYHNYERRLRTLQFIEEIELILLMRKYDCETVCFVRNGEFLMLEIENLAEQRPSIVIGDKVVATNPSNTQQCFEGTVFKVTGQHVHLKFAKLFHDTYKNEDYSTYVVQSRTNFRKCHQAIVMAYKMLGQNILFPGQVNARAPQVEFTYEPYDDSIVKTDKADKSGSVRRKSHRELIEAAKNMSLSNSDSESCKSETDNACFKLQWYNKSLNYYQKEAVRNILLGEARPLPYIIFGPPGTGKTITIVETILQLTRMLPHSRLLVATPSNSAADLITTRLINCKIIKPGDLIRLVSYKSVVEDTIPVHLVPYCATLSLAKQGTSEEPEVTPSGLTLGYSIALVGRHRITIGTCSTLGSLHSLGFKKGHFTHVIVDEAGQCTEPEIMIPITVLDPTEGQVILAGDPLQLGPVLLSPLARDFGLAESYIDRLLSKFPYARDDAGFTKSSGYDPRLVTQLVYNYRSLPGVIHLSNDMFYHSQLRATISEIDSEEAKFLSSLSDILPVHDGKVPSVVFHGVDGQNYQTEDCPSWFNPSEASQVFYYVNELYRLGAKAEDIGIISPYVKQAKQIRAILHEADFDLPKVGTVEEFQGQEFKVIILSTVRSNSQLLKGDVLHSIGFVSSPRRLNVALTRAQCLTVIIGNPQLLVNDRHWQTVLKHCGARKSYLGCAFNA